MVRARKVGVLLLLLFGTASANADPAPFAHTEGRAECASYAKTRQPFFGELHLHTQYSADASTLDTRNTPRDAYRFAKGEPVGIPPFVDTRIQPADGGIVDGPVSPHPYCLPPERCEYTATRIQQLPPGRALDFAAVTDHAEWLGEDNICFWEETQACTADAACAEGQVCFGAVAGAAGKCVPRGYASPNCVLARTELTRLRNGLPAALWATYVTRESPSRFPFCALPGAGGDGTCILSAKNVWQQIISDAEEAYDRTPACRFTSFVAYEYTAMPGMGECANDRQPCFADADCPNSAACLPNTGGGNNLHRNIIFRNAHVPELPVSYVDVPTGCGKGADCQAHQGGALASPVAMLKAVRARCNGRNDCDFISIPHNPNLSGGAMFLMPETPEEAEVRARFEPLVELFQIKGSSECRYSARHPGAWGTLDELCDFENMSFAKLGGPFIADPTPADIPAGSYVRNVLEEGLAYEQQNGINPFRLGFVGSTDSHNGDPGATEESMYAKTGAHGDISFAVSGQALNEAYFLGEQTNPGGLTVAWAEENTRDSIFAALGRRETYATSGTRPVVRFFGGFGLPANMCRRSDFARTGYERGVPMGGMLNGPAKGAPTFAVSAIMDPGWSGHPGTELESIQIVKGWVDAGGHPHERVFDVAGDRHNGATVDLRTCQPEGQGASELCASFTDRDFNPAEHAFYYARVVEDPSCRWNQLYCLSRGVDCSRPSHADAAISSYDQWEYQQCCRQDVPKTIKERAWTSPIWYSPDPHGA